MSELTKDQVVEFLSNLTVIELSNLVSELEEKWGVSAAAPVAVAAMPGGGGGARGGLPGGGAPLDRRGRD